jgi:hypothetical protein
MTDLALATRYTMPRIVVANVTVFAVSAFDPRYPLISAERPNMRVRFLHHDLHVTGSLAFAKGILHERHPIFFLLLLICGVV